MMKVKKLCNPFVISLLVAAALLNAGCGRDTPKADPGSQKPLQVASQTAARDHSGWWCAEHGIPEAICGQCNTKYAAECKKKGDWCTEHDRPDTQCFVHHPELKEKFASQYRAKYGKEPPPTEDETPAKTEKK